MTTLLDPAGRIKPYRSYEYGPDAIKLVLDKKFNVTPNPDITHTVVSALLAEFHISCSARTVSDILEALSVISGTVPIRYAFPDDFKSAYNKLSTAIESIVDLSPQLLSFGSPKSADGRRATDALQHLLKAAEDALPDFPKMSSEIQSAFWHEDAEYLRWILRHARTRAKTQPSFTKPGSPAVRFIQRALVFARLQHPQTGYLLHPTCAAIADALRRKQDLESARAS